MLEKSVVSAEEWRKARVALLEREKAFTRERDALTRQRQELPWQRVSKSYEFEAVSGRKSLAELFGPRSQLVVQHFMFGPDWKEGCPSCSFWADGYDGLDVHLAHRDVTMVTVSRAPLATLQAYRERMGWTIEWVSSLGSEFNADFHVSFSQEQRETGEMEYNYARKSFPSEEAPGISVFFKDGDGEIYHTYSCYSRGLDMMNAAYHYLDLVPKGRDEDALSHSMEWLRRRDQYED